MFTAGLWTAFFLLDAALIWACRILLDHEAEIEAWRYRRRARKHKDKNDG